MNASGPATGPFRADCDVVVVGSGAGGGAAARELAVAGLDTMVLEMGDRFRTIDMTQREEQMMPRLYQDAGSRTTADRTIQVVQGKGLGGSTLHNLNLCKRLPEEILSQWADRYGLVGLQERLDSHYVDMEALLSVSEVPEAEINLNNRLLRAGASALGWANGPLKHNRVGCIGSGFCELGCAYFAKMNSARVLLPEAEARGARLITRVRVTRILHRFGRARGVSGQVLDDRERPIAAFTVRARAVVLAASATGSSALVRSSGLRDPWSQAGRGLALHPGATVGGVFDEPVDAWRGIPQAWECTQFLHPTDPERRAWILPVFGHPVTAAAMLPGLGVQLVERLGQYRHIAALSPMLHDHSRGTVSIDRHGRPVIRYRQSPEDLVMMGRGIRASARILLAAGAREVVIPTARPMVVRSEADMAALEGWTPRPLDPPQAAVHPMGGLRMGSDPRRSSTTPEGRYHQCPNLWVADGSLFPSSTGVPPQLSIYTFGSMVGQAVAQTMA
jgi:choline dehydrogenase-like flavoprotein